MMERTTKFRIANDAAEDVHGAVSGVLQNGGIIPGQGQEGLEA